MRSGVPGSLTSLLMQPVLSVSALSCTLIRAKVRTKTRIHIKTYLDCALWCPRQLDLLAHAPSAVVSPPLHTHYEGSDENTHSQPYIHTLIVRSGVPGNLTSLLMRPVLSVSAFPGRLLKAVVAWSGFLNSSTARLPSMPPPSIPVGWGTCGARESEGV